MAVLDPPQLALPVLEVPSEAFRVGELVSCFPSERVGPLITPKLLCCEPSTYVLL